MNSFFTLGSQTFPRLSVLVSASFVVAVALAVLTPSHSQTPTPAATPADTPSPTVTPSPAPSPTPTPTINPALYLPQAASVQLDGTSDGGTNSAAPRNTVSGVKTRQSASGIITSDTVTPPAQPLTLNSPGLFSPTALAVQPQAATITLAYNVACAGAAVLVAPLDGGSINGAAGGQTITVAADGTLVFSFQAPSGPGRYHVVTRLGTSEIAFPFDVPDPSLAVTPLPSPSPSGN